MVSIATILEEMTRDFVDNPSAEVDYAHYKKIIRRYEPTFLAILEDFEDCVFGEFYNRRNKDQFIEMMAQEGWKYFSLQDLNELFSIFVKDYPP